MYKSVHKNNLFIEDNCKNERIRNPGVQLVVCFIETFGAPQTKKHVFYKTVSKIMLCALNGPSLFTKHINLLSFWEL